MNPPTYDFLLQAGRILNSGQSRSIAITGDVYDLFYMEGEDEGGQYLPLIDFLTEHWSVPDHILVVYELNGPIRFLRQGDSEKIHDAWLKWRTGLDSNELAIKRMVSGRKMEAAMTSYLRDFDKQLAAAIGNPTVALEVLRQICLCSRLQWDEQPLLKQNLIIIIEASDLILPQGEIANMSDADRHRVGICHDWFSDPGFVNGDDSVVLISESRSLINQRISRLPQILGVQVPSPDEAQRRFFISWFERSLGDDVSLQLWASKEDLARCTAGLSMHALMQLLKGAVHQRRILTQEEVIDKVEDYIQSQLGEDMVEFKKPAPCPVLPWGVLSAVARPMFLRPWQRNSIWWCLYSRAFVVSGSARPTSSLNDFAGYWRRCPRC
jgi:hypothetical protein